MFPTRQNWHPVHSTTGPLKTSARRQKTKLHGVHTDIPSVTGRHIAMLLGRKFNKLIPDSHVRNRIKEIRFCTHDEDGPQTRPA